MRWVRTVLYYKHVKSPKLKARLTGVALEVNLRNPLCKSVEAASEGTGLTLKHQLCRPQQNPKQWNQWLHKRTDVLQKFLKKIMEHKKDFPYPFDLDNDLANQIS